MKLRARREFNSYGYNWYPQMWVESHKRWYDVEWAIYRNPAGFTNPRHAIEYVINEESKPWD